MHAKLNDTVAAKSAEAKVAALTAPTAAPAPQNLPGQPSPSPAGTPAGKETYGDLVGATLRGFEQGDVKHLLAKYDEKIAYRDYGVVDREFIRRDLQKYFERWPMTKTRLVGPIEVLDTKRPEEKVVRFKYEFRAASPDRRTFSVGTAWTVWSTSQRPDGVKVWGEVQTVVRRPNH